MRGLNQGERIVGWFEYDSARSRTVEAAAKLANEVEDFLFAGHPGVEQTPDHPIGKTLLIRKLRMGRALPTQTHGLNQVRRKGGKERLFGGGSRGGDAEPEA